MPIAILGTGRSGTSMVTRMLNLCGLYLGEQDKLWDPGLKPSMNPTGYWEHQEIRALTERLFQHLGGSWENPPVLTRGWEQDAALDPLYADAKGIIAHLFGGQDEWAWKLPKATVTIAFWQRVVPDLKFIICVRNPLDFAQSLGRHSSVSRSHLFAMWQYYNYAVLTVTKPEDRIITFYEDFFRCRQAALAPLLEFAGLPCPVPGESVDRCLGSFCDPGLNHHTSTLESVLMDDEVPYVTRQLYLELLTGERSAQGLPLLNYREMLLPLLERALVGEGALDGSGAVSTAKHERVKRKMAALRAESRWRPEFFLSILRGLKMCALMYCLSGLGPPAMEI